MQNTCLLRRSPLPGTFKKPGEAQILLPPEKHRVWARRGTEFIWVQSPEVAQFYRDPVKNCG